MYIEQFLKNDAFLIFYQNIVTPISNLALKKPGAFSCRFLYVSMTFSWTPGLKRLIH